MKKDLIRYSAILVIMITFGLLVYPTIYKYDKLEQKYPVKINRITGDSEVLTAGGWVSSESYDVAADRMLDYKNEVIEQMDYNREQLKQEVISEIKDSIVTAVKADLSAVKDEIAAYKLYEIDPNNSFTVGSTKDHVKKTMGAPDDVSAGYDSESWYYDLSVITFKNGKVTQYSNFSDNLRIK